MKRSLKTPAKTRGAVLRGHLAQRLLRSWPTATITILSIIIGASAAQVDLVGPPGSGQFGASLTVLPNGYFVVTDPGYGAPGAVAGVGAVYLYDGATLELISALTGSTANDQVGSGGLTVLSNGNWVVRSPLWANGTATNAGAVTWGSGTMGVSGVVSAANSLVGSQAGDNVGDGFIRVLPNGSYVVPSESWANGAATHAGAVTWCNGTTGMVGVVSAANSLVGSTANSHVGIGNIYALPNGNYVVCSPYWANGAVTNAGAVTWGSGATGVAGVLSAANSLVGSKTRDFVGDAGLAALPNGNYVVVSRNWANGAATNAGAVTWGDGTTGVIGVVSAANSLVGSTANDRVGYYGGVTVLANGNYVVSSKQWDNGAVVDAGAVTWGSGMTGVSGVVSAANSLVGSKTSDLVGFYDFDTAGITALPNGNYVVRSPHWANGAATNAGAVTWCSGTTGATGVVAAVNSLVGSGVGDLVGGDQAVTALPNGNYVVSSPDWDNGPIPDAGAVTWGKGLTGVTGVVSAANSLVGSTAGDQVGGPYGVTALPNGNYVVRSPHWDKGAVTDAGAVTWGSGLTGMTGVVSAANSLVGSTAGDQVGGYYAITTLSNGNYVVSNYDWDNGGVVDAGAVTWGSGTTGISGAVSSSNSLVGGTAGDAVGNYGVIALKYGNYVVRSPGWGNGTATYAGAVTWGNGTNGVTGVVSAANSLVGSTANDGVGSAAVTALNNGNYVVGSTDWHNGPANAVGAATWCNGTTGLSGAVSASNSLIGGTVGDEIGGIGGGGVYPLTNGNYLVFSPYWNSATAHYAGAVTLGDGNVGVRGPVAATNSVLGTAAGGGDFLVIAFDYLNTRLIVGYPSANRVSLFRYELMSGWRYADQRLEAVDPVYQVGNLRYYYDKHWPDALETGKEYGIYVQTRGGFNPMIRLVDTREGTMFSTNDLLASSSEALLLFTNTPSTSYGIQVSSVETNAIGGYEIALFPVIRPGETLMGVLTNTDRIETNHAESPSPGGSYYFQDFLLLGLSANQDVQVSLESTNIDSYLEVVYLHDESEVRHDNNSGVGTNALIPRLAVTANRSFLLRVSSYQPLQTGYYTLSVRLLVPEISSFSPSGAFVGDTVNINGRYLDTVQYVTFGGTVATVPFAQVETNLQVSVPVGAGTGALSVASPSGTGTTTNSFVVWSSRPQLRTARFGTNETFAFEVSGAASGTVVIESATNLASPIVWRPVLTNTLSGGGTLSFTDNSTDRPAQRFYRARVF